MYGTEDKESYMYILSSLLKGPWICGRIYIISDAIDQLPLDLTLPVIELNNVI